MEVSMVLGRLGDPVPTFYIALLSCTINQLPFMRCIVFISYLSGPHP